jgi:hypothetical protein
MATTKTVPTKELSEKDVPAKVGAAKEAPKKRSAPVLVDDATPEFFVDGVNEFLLGSNVSKLTFFSKIAVDKRAQVLRLTLPTVALVDICMNVLKAAKNGEERMSVSNAKLLTRMSEILADAPAKFSSGSKD